MTVTSSPPAVRVTATSTRMSLRGTHADRTPVILMHGDPFDAPASTIWQDFRNWPRATGPGALAWGFLMAGHPVHVVWTGANWGAASTVAYPPQGGTGLNGIDALVADIGASTVHVVGVSMGGTNAAVWCSRNKSMVASLTLIEPAVDPMALWDTFNAEPSPFDAPARELGTVWASDPAATRATIAAAVDTAGVDSTSTAAALTSLAARIQILQADDDTVVTPGPVWSWADAVGVPAGQRFHAATGGHTESTLDPIWSDMQPLRHAQRFEVP